MKAGRELDALIAEQVMGCKPGKFPHLNLGHDYACPCKDSSHAGSPNFANIAHYSTDIAAAWEVVEKIGEIKGIHGGLTLSVGKATTFAAFGTKGYSGRWEAFSEDDGAHTPHAICLAALKAVQR